MIIETANFYIAVIGSAIGGAMICFGVMKYFIDSTVFKLCIRIHKLEEELKTQKTGIPPTTEFVRLSQRYTDEQIKAAGKYPA